MSAETGTVELPTTPALYYLSGDCTGTTYVSPLPPRLVFQHPTDGTRRVRPDSLTSAVINAASMRSIGYACAPLTNFPVRVIQLDLTAVVTASPPTTNFVAPLHEVPL